MRERIRNRSGEDSHAADRDVAWHLSDRRSTAARTAWTCIPRTPALALVGEQGVPDELYRSVREHFSEKELVDLTMAVVAINGWNRISISFRPPVGEYQPQATAA